MNKIKAQDKIFNFFTNSEHFVESVENFDDISVVFTTDNFCFPLNQVVKIENNLIWFFYKKILKKQKLSSGEETLLTDMLISLIPENHYDSKKFEQKIQEIEKSFWFR